MDRVEKTSGSPPVGEDPVVRWWHARGLGMWFAMIGVYSLLHFGGTHLRIQPAVAKTVGDKSLHFMSFFGLGSLLALYPARSMREAVIRLVGLALWAGFDELTQPFFRRQAEWLDWTADVAGGTTGYLVTTAILTWIRHRATKTAA